jgi:hypothetical protein
MVCRPAPAVDGEKVPLPLMPDPNQVPPAVAALRETGASLEQKGPAGVIVASGVLRTVITSVSELVHPF